jgi:protein AroM
MVDVLVSRGTLGVIVPHAEMLIRQRKERSRPGVRVATTALVPGSDQAAVDATAFQLVAQQPDRVLMDCMSYSRTEMTWVATVLSCFVLLPSVLAVGAVARLLEADR